MTPSFLYGTAWKKDRTTQLVELAVRAGFTAVDTANQLKHYDEARVGEALRKLAGEGYKRETLFLQTKFTSPDGQDHRLPYDPASSIADQVAQSFQSSLDHLHTDYLDSYVLHGPYNHPGLGEEDWEVWGAMEALHRAGRARELGISNVNAMQLEALVSGAKVKPTMVQNRCYANRGWDGAVRAICRAHGIRYQGFSLLTANPQVLAHASVRAIASRLSATPEQVVFRFAVQVGMLPLTGTTDPAHMKEDLKALSLALSDEETALIESIG